MVRIILIILLLALGLWQAGADWQATIGEGYAYRFTNIGEALSEIWPDRFGAEDEGPRSRHRLAARDSDRRHASRCGRPPLAQPPAPPLNPQRPRRRAPRAAAIGSLSNSAASCSVIAPASCSTSVIVTARS